MRDPAEQELRTCITLVHGTWPRGVLPSLSRLWGGGRCWFESGSNFWNALQKSQIAKSLVHSSRTRAFLWSGANSITERNRAAQDLAHLLMAEKQHHRYAQQLIIAHSHGGNVALRALHILPQDFPRILVVTIATPFVEIRPKKVNPDTARRMRTFRRKERQDRSALLRRLYLQFRWFFELRSIKRQRKLQSATNLGGLRTGLGQHRLFVLRAIDDEAALVLAAGAIANRATTALLELVAYLWLVLIGFFFLFILTAMAWLIVGGLSGMEMSTSFIPGWVKGTLFFIYFSGFFSC